MRFCQALMLGSIATWGPTPTCRRATSRVGGREVSYMAGMMKKLTNSAECVFTGKGLSFGGSLIRPATGYGLLYFVDAMLAHRGQSLDGLRVSVSGSGNVAQYAIEGDGPRRPRHHRLRLGGTVYDPDGFTPRSWPV